MKVGLFIPCYIDQFYPGVAINTLQLLEKFGMEVAYPEQQTCCGQPMANGGFENNSYHVYNNFVKLFSDYDVVVAPSASCVYHVKKHYDVLEQSGTVEKVRNNIYELTDFLTSKLQVTSFPGKFESNVGLHISCHGQRGLRQMTCSEMSADPDGKIISLLRSIDGLKLTNLTRKDECCGFGGVFCVSEESVSSRMGIDRIYDHRINGTQILTGTDMSCLMHLEGVVRRQKLPIEIMHVAEIFNKAMS